MNGVAEAEIKNLKDLGRTMMIHANQQWPEAITTHLWPYAVRMVNDAMNSTPNSKAIDGRTPIQAIDRSNIHMNVKHWHPFG